MSNKYRTIYCGCVTEENINNEIKLAGWIDKDITDCRMGRKYS